LSTAQADPTSLALIYPLVKELAEDPEANNGTVGNAKRRHPRIGMAWHATFDALYAVSD
jgi:hypothetical protein